MIREYAVIGSGIGGSSIAAYLSAQGKNVVLVEKEPYLGGCASTFERGGYRYNAGATTFSGFEEDHGVKKLFDAVGITPDLIRSDPSIVTIQGDKVVPRYSSLERFLEHLDTHYPHEKNREFWGLVLKLSQTFYAHNGYHYSNASLWRKLGSLTSYLPLAKAFFPYLTCNAKSYIERFFGTLDPEYWNFIEAQLYIVTQERSDKVNFLTAALALAYPFHPNYVPHGGMGALFEQLAGSTKEVLRNCRVERICKERDHYVLECAAQKILARKIILNSTVYDSGALFEAPDIKNYYARYKPMNNHQSAFVLYMTLKSDAVFEHHYQIIRPEAFKHTLSNALFVSFSDRNDTLMAPKGHYSVTASLHTDTRWWQEKSDYKAKKKELEAILLQCICGTLHIEPSQILTHFSATPKTFGRYIMREQLGGNAMSIKNFLPRLPGNDTPIENLYHVGDSVYAAQGWPGVMTGVWNLIRQLDEQH